MMSTPKLPHTTSADRSTKPFTASHTNTIKTTGDGA